jgi:hypothetical protein
MNYSKDSGEGARPGKVIGRKSITILINLALIERSGRGYDEGLLLDYFKTCKAMANQES